jgi:hypothetical protein
LPPSPERADFPCPMSQTTQRRWPPSTPQTTQSPAPHSTGLRWSRGYRPGPPLPRRLPRPPVPPSAGSARSVVPSSSHPLRAARSGDSCRLIAPTVWARRSWRSRLGDRYGVNSGTSPAPRRCSIAPWLGSASWAISVGGAVAIRASLGASVPAALHVRRSALNVRAGNARVHT